MNRTAEQQPLTRDRLKSVTLIIVTAIGVVACIVIAAPFVPALTWALALAVVAHPLHSWIARRVSNPSVAAVMAVAAITIGLLVPTILVIRQVAQEAAQFVKTSEESIKSGELADQLERAPKIGGIVGWVRNNINIEREFGRLGESIQGLLGKWVQGTIWTIAQLLITIFLLFYFFRDRKQALNAVASFLPLSTPEARDVIERVRKMIHATIYGTIVVAAIQGALGGLMFWVLGIPAALLWGVAMGLLAIIPVLGAFIIWVPAAIALAAEGSVGKAVILAGWGTVVVSLIDNLLYPMLVGKEIRLHTVPVFIAIVGGLLLFGASGLVLGPVILAITLACIDVLRRRTEKNGSAESPL